MRTPHHLKERRPNFFADFLNRGTKELVLLKPNQHHVNNEYASLLKEKGDKKFVDFLNRETKKLFLGKMKTKSWF